MITMCLDDDEDDQECPDCLNPSDLCTCFYFTSTEGCPVCGQPDCRCPSCGSPCHECPCRSSVGHIDRNDERFFTF